MSDKPDHIVDPTQMAVTMSEWPTDYNTPDGCEWPTDYNEP